jgi:hypothetical protein
MARAQGARSVLAAAFETTYGTAPAAGQFWQMPFASSTLGSEQPLLASELLGYGRDPQPPVKDVITADGDVVVPVDLRAWGVWLKGAFGAPTTTGTTPKTHTFKSGSWSLPSLSVEVGMPEVPYYSMLSGVMVNTLSWQMRRGGLLTTTAGLIAQGETVGAASTAGALNAYTLERFGQFNGAIKRNSVSLANIVSAEVTYNNNLDRIETIRSDGKIDGADPSLASLTGQIVARFADQTLLTDAVNGTPCALELSFAISASKSFTLTIPKVYLPKPRLPINGPQGVQATFAWQAAYDSSLQAMCSAVLVNDVANYNNGTVA